LPFLPEGANLRGEEFQSETPPLKECNGLQKKDVERHRQPRFRFSHRETRNTILTLSDCLTLT
jgi:hypothetical protein